MKITIDKAEAMRYLGHRGQSVDSNLDSLIDDILRECESLARPLSFWQEFPVAAGEEGVVVRGTTLQLPGQDIAAHLKDANACVLMAATLGPQVDRAICAYEHTDLTRSVILDAAATAMIEQVCDLAEAEVRGQAAERNLTANFRFSPGYGDLPLELQPNLLEVLQAGKRIGLTCSPSLIMLPRKSVSAILGLFPGKSDAKVEGASCLHCPAREQCNYRKDDAACGYPSTD